MATMDTNVADYGGYEYHFVEEPPIDLKCLICRAVAKQPQQHGQCGKLYCLSCITEHMKTRSQCAHCRQDLTTFTDGKSKQTLYLYSYQYSQLASESMIKLPQTVNYRRCSRYKGLEGQV